MTNLNIDPVSTKTEPEINSAWEAATTLHQDLDSKKLANPLDQDQELQKLNLDDLHLATDIFNSLKSFKLTPEDKKLFQELSGALKSPGNISNLSGIREKLQAAVNQRTEALADLKRQISASTIANNKDICRAIDLENGLRGIRLANELARA